MASRYRVPAIYFNAAFFAKLGGLVTYGPDFTEYHRLLLLGPKQTLSRSPAHRPIPACRIVTVLAAIHALTFC
jgi:hypothetical protein